MASHSSTRKLQLVVLASHADQSKIGGPAAHIPDQDNLPVEQQLARLSRVCRDPSIKGSRGFFQKRKVLQPSLLRRIHRQFSRLFIKRRRNGQRDPLFGKRTGVRTLPSTS